MTLKLRPKTRRARRGLLETDERRDTLVVAGFIGLIALLGVGLVAAFGFSYYDNNIRALASVGSVQISPGLVRDRTALDQLRLTRDEGRFRVLQQTNEISATDETTAVDSLNQQAQAITADSIKEELIDLIYENQLASAQSVAPSAADISAAVDREFNLPEQRHYLIITVKPDTTAGAAPTVVQRQAAMDKANQALAALNSGTDWATVAKQYSSDPSAANGGDGGTISADNPVDASWTKALFALPQGGTTAAIASAGCPNSSAGGCIYRIGRVTSITPGGQDTAYHDKLLAKLSADSVRQIVGWELAADNLRKAITAGATTGSVDQIHLAEIIIRNTSPTGDLSSPSPSPSGDQSEVHFAQILYAPNHDASTAPDLPAIDPAWQTAGNAANADFATLTAIADPTARATKFSDIAKASSDDDATKAGGGDVPFTTRDVLPTEVAAALFDTPHNAGDLIGPIKSQSGYYILLFHEHRGSPQQRLAQLQADIAANVDWNTLVTKYTDGTDADKTNGGDIGWFTRDMLKTVDQSSVGKMFALQTGQISAPILFSTDSYVFKAIEHSTRPLDPDQVTQLNDPTYGAFANWYSDKKNAAEANGTITRAGQANATGAPS